MRAAVAADPNYPPVLFVVQGQPEDAASFFAEYWPEARAVSDPDFELYRAFGLERGSPVTAFNPSLMVCGLRAMAKGNIQGRTVGDALQMPGLFLMSGGTAVWTRDYAHFADSPNWKTLPARLTAEARSPLPAR